MEKIQTIFLTDGPDRVFRLFRGEQRAIGEKLTVPEEGRLSCMGYASFLETEDESFRRWFSQLEQDVDILSNDPGNRGARLVKLQHALIDLLDYLDPSCVRFQKKYRQRA